MLPSYMSRPCLLPSRPTSPLTASIIHFRLVRGTHGIVRYPDLLSTLGSLPRLTLSLFRVKSAKLSLSFQTVYSLFKKDYFPNSLRFNSFRTLSQNDGGGHLPTKCAQSLPIFSTPGKHRAHTRTLATHFVSYASALFPSRGGGRSDIFPAFRNGPATSKCYPCPRTHNAKGGKHRV